MDSDPLSQAVRQTLLRLTPLTSLRALAFRVEVSHQLLAFVVSGQRNATPAVATKLAVALETLSDELGQGAQAIRRALPRSPTGSSLRKRPRHGSESA